MENVDILVIGGGAAGYFGAITAAQARPSTRVVIVERGNQPLALDPLPSRRARVALGVLALSTCRHGALV